ncbi:MAG: hypothetical protein ACRCW2_13090, partial [Cellulosilyticaceae bacterium]
MCYLLKIKQDERTYDIGVFKSEETINQFVEGIPFVKKEMIHDSYPDYYMKFEDVPDYYEVNYNNYLYVISKFSFIPSEDEIYFTWSKIHLWDQQIAKEKTLIEGETVVDAYVFANNEVEDYITKREALYRETES